jgi:hypothetical protein
MVMLDRLLSGEQAELAFGASVIERDVQCAEGAHGLFDERDDVILSGHISSHEQGASTARSNLLGELLSLGNAAAGDDHIRAFFGKTRTVALPMPELPPVIRTVLFSKLFMVGLNVTNAEYSAK